MSIIKQAQDFVKWFGYKELIKKPFVIFSSPFVTRWHRKHKFLFDGKEFELFYHRYNLTWTKERGVEIPIAKYYMKKTSGKILEVGNVMQNYYKRTWDVLDKYEKFPGVINEDIETFKPKEKYDLIVSISTLEHVGFDEDMKNQIESRKEKGKLSEEKIIKSIENLKKNCLKKGGKMIIITPIAWNQGLDDIIFNNIIKFDKKKFMKRIKSRKWIEVDDDNAKKTKFGEPFGYANCIFIGEYKKK